MNKRARNWSILAAIFAVISLIIMTFTNQPALGWAVFAVAFVCAAMWLIRFEDGRSLKEFDDSGTRRG